MVAKIISESIIVEQEVENSNAVTFFLLRLTLAFSLIGLCYWAIATHYSLFVRMPCIIILGAMYAHLIELQHMCLHEAAFPSRKLNRFFGVIFGLPMLSSYSHYKYEHLLHHANLGTTKNKEFFNYKFRNLDSPVGFLIGMFHLGRYVDVFNHLILSFTTWKLKNTPSNWQKRIKQEYRIYAFCIITAIFISMFTGPEWSIVYWILPAVFAEAFHFLIELPEHYGLDTITNPNVFENTRTIYTWAIFEWYVNYNNLHTVHHYSGKIPIQNVRSLLENGTVQPADFATELSYLKFYQKVISGEISHDPSKNCMTR